MPKSPRAASHARSFSWLAASLFLPCLAWLLCPPEALLTKQLEHHCTMVIRHDMPYTPSNDATTSGSSGQQQMRTSKRLTCLWEPVPIALKPQTSFWYTPPLPSAATSRTTGSAATYSGLKSRGSSFFATSSSPPAHLNSCSAKQFHFKIAILILAASQALPTR